MQYLYVTPSAERFISSQRVSSSCAFVLCRPREAMANPGSGVLCLGCGEVVQRSSERSNLMTTTSQHVVPLWKEVVGSELQRRGRVMDLDGIVSESGARYMCRKCFYAYEKVLKARAVIEANAAKAVIPNTSLKRSSPNLAVLPPAKRCPVSSCSTSGKEPSPHVSVSSQYLDPVSSYSCYIL